MAETVIQTDRLNLRTWDEADIETFHRDVNSPAVMRWLGGVQSLDDVRAAYARITQCNDEHGHCFWIAERRSDGEMLGFCGLKRVNAKAAPDSVMGEFEIGWRFREDAWGQGYAKESALAVLDRGFDQLGAERIVALTVAQNDGSWGLMERLGMKRRSDLDFVDPEYPTEIANTIMYMIDQESWLSRR